MTLSAIDWIIVSAYFAISLAVGIWASKQAGEDTKSFFLAGRNMPWWLLGVSMVATTFSTDTPNLVTDLVRRNGVSGNWTWWAFLLTGMLTVFVYSKLWRRSGVLTDIEFYELRYSGQAAAFLRGFRALYLGLVFNILVMGAVSLAAVKFGEIVLGWPGWMTLTIAGSITLVYSALGGLTAVIITDFVQFILAMIGSIWGMFYILGLPEIGGLSNLINHENVSDKLVLFPDFSNPDVWIPILLVPLAVQWWASYYPGAEPGGGGYIAQRMFSAKDEQNAVGATFLFNVAHYALRPWPWILIALSSLIVFPELALIGYPPQDLLLRNKFINNAAIAVAIVSALSFFIPELATNSLYATLTGLFFIWLFTYTSSKGFKSSGNIQIFTTIAKLMTKQFMLELIKHKEYSLFLGGYLQPLLYLDTAS